MIISYITVDFTGIMGFGFGRKKHNGIKGTGFGNSIKPIDKTIMGTDGTKGMVGKAVKPIDKKTRNVFDPMS